MWRLTLTARSRHVSQRSRSVLSFHRSIREKSASKMPLTKLSRYSRLFRIPARKDFLWKRCFLFFIQLDIYYYITRDYVRGRLSKLRTFSLLKNRERKSVFEKIFNKYISHHEMNVKDEPVSRVYLTNVYIFKDGRVSFIGTVERSRARAC